MGERQSAASAPQGRLVDGWGKAERRLAMLAVHDPDAYLRHLEVVGRVTQRLRDYGDLADLCHAFADGELVVRSVIQGEDRPAGGELDVAAIAGTAWMVRYRDLTAARSRQQIAGRIREARRRGATWVKVWDDTPRPESATAATGQRLIMRISDGVAVHASVDIDPDTYRPRYAVAMVRLDPATGLPVADPSTTRPEKFADHDMWEHRVAALLDRLGAPPRI